MKAFSLTSERKGNGKEEINEIVRQREGCMREVWVEVEDVGETQHQGGPETTPRF